MADVSGKHLFGRFLKLTRGPEPTIWSRYGVKAPDLYIGSEGSEVAVLGSTSVQAATSDSTGTTLNFGGYVTITSISTQTWNIAAPAPGRSVLIQRLSTTTGSSDIVTLASGNIITTGTSGTSLRLTGTAAVMLHGLSTALATYQVISTNAGFVTPTTG